MTDHPAEPEIRIRVALLMPREHFHAALVLRRLAGLRHTKLLVVTTPKFTTIKGRKKTVRALLRESGARYVWSMAMMKLWYAQRVVLERAAGTPVEARRFLPVHESIALSGCEHAHFERVDADECRERLEHFAPHLMFSVFFNQIVPAELIALATEEGSAYNIHPSPLPSYRGISPAFWALSDGSPTSGVTIHELTPNIDQGEYVARREFSIDSRDSVFGVYRRSAEEAAALAVDLVERLRKGQALPNLSKPSQTGSYRSKITREAVQRLARRRRKFFHWIAD
jgi:methionyl-tRNA formyltransferase